MKKDSKNVEGEVKGLKKFYQEHKTACLFVGGALVGAGLAAGGYYIYTNYFKQDTDTDMSVITVTDDDVEALKGATSLTEALKKSYDNGFSEGYDGGLDEGYNRGLNANFPDYNDKLHARYLEGTNDGAVKALHAVGEMFPDFANKLGTAACEAFEGELQALPNYDAIEKLLDEGLNQKGCELLDPMNRFMESEAVEKFLQFGKDLVNVTHIDKDGWAIAPDDVQ